MFLNWHRMYAINYYRFRKKLIKIKNCLSFSRINSFGTFSEELSLLKVSRQCESPYRQSTAKEFPLFCSVVALNRSRRSPRRGKAGCRTRNRELLSRVTLTSTGCNTCQGNLLQIWCGSAADAGILKWYGAEQVEVSACVTGQLNSAFLHYTNLKFRGAFNIYAASRTTLMRFDAKIILPRKSLLRADMFW